MFAMTYSDMQTAADKCEEMEEGYTQCSQFLYGQFFLFLCFLLYVMHAMFLLTFFMLLCPVFLSAQKVTTLEISLC